MAAPVIQSSTTVDTLDGSNQIVLNKPTGLADNDVLYIMVVSFDVQNPYTSTHAPSGFTFLSQARHANVPHPAVAIYRKVVTSASGEPSTYTVGSPNYGGSKYGGGVCYRVSGVDTTTPEDDNACITSNASTGTTGSVIDSSGSEALLLVACVNTLSSSPGTPSGMTKDLAGDGGDACVYSQTISSQLVSAARTSTFGGAADYSIGFVVIKPAAGVTPNPVGARRIRPRPLRKVKHGMFPHK